MNNRTLLFVLTWALIGIMYFPIFLAAWLLHIVARILLGISYFGMLNSKMGRDILKSIFNWNPTL